jgi:hypothetical protein
MPRDGVVVHAISRERATLVVTGEMDVITEILVEVVADSTIRNYLIMGLPSHVIYFISLPRYKELLFIRDVIL